jgi:tRNA modification GTPase
MSTTPIARLLTPPGKGGIAVVSLMGDGAKDLVPNFFTPHRAGQSASTGELILGNLIDDAGDPIDEALLGLTGQSVEINIHGGPVVTHAALKRLAELGVILLDEDRPEQAGLRWTHPNWNNRAIGEELSAILPKLLSPLAVDTLCTQWSAGLSQLVFTEPVSPAALRRAARQLPIIQKLIHPPHIVLAGPPNAGKSTLANALTGREVSIVDPMTGTTRDWVSTLAVIDGVGVQLTDTAGIFDVAIDNDPHGIDAQSVARARQRATQADLVVLLTPGARPAIPEWLIGKRVLCVATHCDRAGCDGAADACISAMTGEGMVELESAMLDALGLRPIDPHAPAAFTPRQSKLLIAAADALEADDRPLARALLDELLLG